MCIFVCPSADGIPLPLLSNGLGGRGANQSITLIVVVMEIIIITLEVLPLITRGRFLINRYPDSPTD